MTPDDWITLATLLTPIILFPCLWLWASIEFAKGDIDSLRLQNDTLQRELDFLSDALRRSETRIARETKGLRSQLHSVELKVISRRG